MSENKDNLESKVEDYSYETFDDQNDDFQSVSPEATRENVTQHIEKTKKQFKTAKKIGAVIIAFFVVVIAGLIVITFSTTAKNALVTAMMPKSITAGANDNYMKFYIERNKDYDVDKDQATDAWKCYYLGGDDGKTKQYLDNGVYVSHVGGENQIVIAGFFSEAMAKFNVVKNVIKVVAAVIVAAIVVFCIWLWYLSFCMREDKKKLAKFNADSLEAEIVSEIEEEKPKKPKKAKKNRKR